MGDKVKNWIDEMVQRQAIPQAAREETTEEWCKLKGKSPQAYYYQLSKPENQKKIIEISLNKAKNELPDVLETLIANSKKGKEKSIEMYLDYVIKLAKKLDLDVSGEINLIKLLDE